MMMIEPEVAKPSESRENVAQLYYFHAIQNAHIMNIV